MSRPANPGTRAVLNARARKKEIAAERKSIEARVSELDTEEEPLDAFLAQCERYATKTPADQLQPQAVGSAEQGDGAPSRGDGTPPPIASPCSAEATEYPEERSGTAREAPSTHGPETAPMRGDGEASSHDRDARTGDVENVGVQPAAPPNSYPEIPEQLRRPAPAQKA